MMMATSTQLSAPVPQHVAIIMDGNGRWAKSRGLPRAAGHERGVEALRNIVDVAGTLGVKYLTVFSFSTENWRRPMSEVNALFGLLRAYVKRDLKRLKKEGVRIRVIGQREGLPSDIEDLIEKAENETRQNSRAHLTIAFNYGGQEEIVSAARRLAMEVAAGTLDPSDIDIKRFEGALATSDLPSPDLLIRTSGENRISNFLLWQIAYTELAVVDTLWPDFDEAAFKAALSDYATRDRRFGGLSEGTK